ncbi:MAG: reverse transcriptase family protein [Polyangiaceae bacterium]
MTLAELIRALEPLLADPHANAARITELLEKNSDLAEMEVARLYVSRCFVSVVEEQAKSEDPRERMLAARAVPLVIGRSVASRVLRRLVKDSDVRTRKSARAGMRKLLLDDVALPDTRYKVPKWQRPLAIGGWNPTGWSFGLFGGELRYSREVKTVSRNRAQLTRTGLPPKIDLPKIETPTELARFLGLKWPRDLTAWLRPGEEKGAGYVAFEIPKRTGGARRIHAPKMALKKAQRRILDEILARIPAHDACHGFVKGRGIVTNAKPHQGARVVVKMDLADFFPTIHYRRVRGLFAFYGYPPAVAQLLAGLCTHRSKLADGRVAWPGVLPQGAPTSPAIANIVCRRLDARLAALAKKAGATYTRYADDLTFSFPANDKGESALELGRFFWWVDQICQSEGFTENAKKRRVLRRSTAQRVTGVVVNDKLSAPREVRRKLRAMVDRCRKRGLAAVAAEQGRPDLAAVMAGTAAYIAMVQPEAGQKLVRAVAEVTARAEGQKS